MLTDAQRKLVEELTSLADAVASRMRPGDDDARSVAYLALCRAVERYVGEPDELRYYAAGWIRQSIIDANKRQRPSQLTRPDLVKSRYDTDPTECLPDRLRPLARAVWIDGYTIEETAKLLRIPRRKIPAMLREAREYACK